MEYRAIATVDDGTIKAANAILNEGVRIATGEDVVFSVVVEFPDGFSADVKLVNGEPPYVDPVLFNVEGCEVSTLCPESETLDGEFRWTVKEDEYVLTVGRSPK
jgi:hypothetical protein